MLSLGLGSMAAVVMDERLSRDPAVEMERLFDEMLDKASRSAASLPDWRVRNARYMVALVQTSALLRMAAALEVMADASARQGSCGT